MDTPKEILLQYFWLLRQWWFWVIFIIGMIAYWYLFSQRSYKEINRKLFVRHGRLGKWIDIEEHLKNEHPLEYELMKREQKRK
jgi:type II secretory pathway component PulF